MSSKFDEFIQQVLDANDIVNVVGSYVTLNRKGKTWWTNCPFHYEKTPSFAVNELEQYFHCFGCGVSGNIFNFVQRMENCDFYDSLKLLAERANLKMPEITNDVAVTEAKKEKEQLYNVLKDAALYYFHNINDPKAEIARKYIQKRKLNNESIKAFAIGYSLGWHEVINHLKTKGYSLEVMQKAGIIEKKENNYYDVYAKRLIFPLINNNDNVIGFSARILEDVDLAKYRNTAETPVFKKNECVYGINLIKKLKRSEDVSEIIIVEGQMDVISLYKAGVKNAVACLGTALTQNHSKQLKRYVNKVVVCFDGDGAGKKATLRSLDILVSAGLDVYVAALPAGIDPDEFVIKYGVDEYKQLIKDSKYWVEYLINEYAKQFNLKKADERSNFVISALEIIKKLPSLAEQNIYLEMVKSLTNIAMDVLRADLKNIDNVKNIKTTEPEKLVEETILLDQKANPYVKAIKFVMAALLHKKEYAKLNVIIKNNILDNDILKIYEYIESCLSSNKTPIISYLFDMIDTENNPIVNDIINYNFNEINDNVFEFKQSLKVLEKIGLEKKQTELLNIRSLEPDIEKRKVISQEIQQIIIKLKNLK